jgi:glycosyltransferase involved in cell wall biosynthesis
MDKPAINQLLEQLHAAHEQLEVLHRENRELQRRLLLNRGMDLPQVTAESLLLGWAHDDPPHQHLNFTLKKVRHKRHDWKMIPLRIVEHNGKPGLTLFATQPGEPNPLRQWQENGVETDGKPHLLIIPRDEWGDLFLQSAPLEDVLFMRESVLMLVASLTDYQLGACTERILRWRQVGCEFVRLLDEICPGAKQWMPAAAGEDFSEALHKEAEAVLFEQPAQTGIPSQDRVVRPPPHWQSAELSAAAAAGEASFKQANELFRRGQWEEALAHYEALRKISPGFSHYDKWYALCRINLESRTGEGEPPKLECFDTAIHPGSRENLAGVRKISVVTPVFNGEAYIEQTIRSIVEQRGDFAIDYLIADGCSGDRTLQILKEWMSRVRCGDLPLPCAGLRFSFISRPDKGLYDAIAKGFALLAELDQGSGDISTYLNADDVFLPGAFQIATNIFSNTPARWICGQPQTMDVKGSLHSPGSFPCGYAKEDIMLGRHAGNDDLYFIQQEGTFWLRSLYDECGGLNTRIELAADFDLWVRFASQTELLAVDRALAAFRVRPGQLSEQAYRYRNEIAAHVKYTMDSSPLAIPDNRSPNLFFWPQNAPKIARKQRPGPVCFLNDDLSIREIAYLQRSWFSK